MIRSTLLSFAIVAGGATAPACLHAQAATTRGGQLIVQLKADHAAGSASQRQSRLKVVLAQADAALQAGDPLTGGGGNWHRVSAPAGTPQDMEARVQRLRADPRVQSVLPDVREQRRDATPNDTQYPLQWWLQAVTAGNTGVAGFSKAWDTNRGNPVSGSGPVVAVLDSGITAHPELSPRLLPGYDFVSDGVYAADGNGRDNDPSDPGDAITSADRTGNPSAFGGCADQPQSSWHGTIIAGQLAAVTNNGDGVAAANWNGRVVPVRVAGKCGAAVSDIIDGMRWAAGLSVAGVPVNPNPARVIVLSYSGVDACDVNSPNASLAATARLYTDAIAEVRGAGAVLIVAAGNQQAAIARPGACTGAFAVVALNREGYKARYASFGSAAALATPGGDAAAQGVCDSLLADTGLVSTGNLGSITPGEAGYVGASGSSFAAPAVAAAASLMWAVNPALSAAQVEDGLRRSARPHVLVPQLGNCAAGSSTNRCSCTTSTCGAGMLDAAEALVYATAPANYVAPARAPPTLSDDRLVACRAAMGLPPLTDTPPTPAPAPAPSAGSSGGGGGAMSFGWLAGLALAAAGLRRARQY